MALFIPWVHVLSAISWVGGMLFIALVLVPTARALGDERLRMRLKQKSGCAVWRSGCFWGASSSGRRRFQPTTA